MTAPWTFCARCLKPVEVVIIERTAREGAGWSYDCPAPCYGCDDDATQREREAGAGPVDWDRDIPPPDPLAVLSGLVAVAVERCGREAVGVALGFSAAPPAVDPNQINLHLGTTP